MSGNNTWGGVGDVIIGERYITIYIEYYYLLESMSVPTMPPPTKRRRKLSIHSPQELMAMCKSFRSIINGTVNIEDVYKMYGWTLPEWKQSESADDHVWNIVKHTHGHIRNYANELMNETQAARDSALGLTSMTDMLWQALRSNYMDSVPKGVFEDDDLDNIDIGDNGEGLGLDDQDLDLLLDEIDGKQMKENNVELRY